MLLPLPECGKNRSLLRIQPLPLDAVDIAVVLLPQRQKVVLTVQLPQELAHLGLYVVTFLGQRPQANLAPGDPLL